ncbi:unnamed protein product [Caenorhabditis angaria]|uniref:SXP/RAL-2 family protein Ani s 5-like cation-binding domain-containing protein n=1 Tax=Caenorhabditis angaria TaxID=860376 RepID=A0A9P1MYV3_9PELO|nr:unnamed protein product [Caenorhabditis angaria]
MFLHLPILLLISSQVFAEPAHPLISHEEAQFVAYTLMRATESAGPTVEKLGRILKDPFIVKNNVEKTVKDFVKYLKDLYRNREASDDTILRQEQEDIGYFEDRKAILYYRTKQFQPEKFERVYNEQDGAEFKNWARKQHAETMPFNAERKKFLNDIIHDVQLMAGSFNFTFKYQEHSDVYRVVEFEKSFYIEEIQFDVDGNNRFF